MKTSIRTNKLALVIPIAVAVMIALPLTSALAKPGGVYKGDSSGNLIIPLPVGIFPLLPFATVDFKLRLPNRKGRITGKMFMSQTGLPGVGDVPITGRVKESIARRGGKKHIQKGRWTWDFSGVALPPPAAATGKFSIVIRKVGRKYRFVPSEKVKVEGPAAPGTLPYRFTSVVEAKK